MNAQPTPRIIERFQNGLETLKESTERLEHQLTRFFEKLKERGMRPNTDADSLLQEVWASQRRLERNAQEMLWLHQQSMELARVSSLVSSSLNVQKVLEGVMDTVIQLTEAERAYIMLSRGEDMEIVAARNWVRENMSEEDIVFSRRVVRMAIETGEPVTTANAAEDTRFQTADSILIGNLRSILCVPLVLRGKIIGVLYSDNPIQRGVFRQDSLPIMVAFAQQTAVAIENAQLYQRLERANTQLQEANKLKSEFLSVISHELKTPFSGLGMALQIFPRYGMDHMPADQVKAWDDVVEGVNKAQSLINNLVNYAGLLSKQGTLELVKLDLIALLNETVEDAARLARNRGVTITTEYAADRVEFFGDRDRLSEAFWHLLQNAIQYNVNDGHVWIRVDGNDSMVQIDFEDTGVGIPAADQERLWGAFEQMGSSLTRGVEGLGLGLPLVRYVIKAHGGDVTLQSEVNRGSLFMVRLPLR